MFEGLLGGFADLVGGYFGRVQAAKQAAMEAPYRQQLAGLLGSQPVADMGPPDASGGMGMSGGTGLLANPNDPNKQLAFAAGVMGLPGQQQLGASLLSGAFQRAQQGQQFEQAQAQQGAQFSQGFDQRERQFLQTHDLARAQFTEQQAYRDLQQQNWERQFTAARQAEAFNQGIAGATLDLNRGRFALEQQTKGDDALPKLSPGYMYVQSAAGKVAAPIPGTKPYADAVDADGSLEAAQRRITQIVDIMQGAERTVGGRKVRAGGTGGTELYGTKAATLGQLRAQVIADLGVLQNTGVLQKSDLERYDELLADPTAVSSLGRKTSSMVAGYTTLRDEFKDKQRRHRVSNPWLLPPPPRGAVVEGQ